MRTVGCGPARLSRRSATGAIVFVQVGPALSFAINAVTFLVSYAAIRSVPKVATATEVSPPRARSFGRELVEPLRAIASVPMLRMLLVAGGSYAAMARSDDRVVVPR